MATVRPRTRPPWPAVMFVNGATPDGRAHPGVRRFAASLARAGYVVFIPELPGVAAGELSLLTLAASVECAMARPTRPRPARTDRSLRCLGRRNARASRRRDSPDLSARISVVACIAPFTDLEKVTMLATTGTYPGSDGLVQYPVPPELAVGVARSLVGILDPTPDGMPSAASVGSLDPASRDPLRPVARRALQIARRGRRGLPAGATRQPRPRAFRLPLRGSFRRL